MNWKEQEMNTLGWSDLWEEVCADRGHFPCKPRQRLCSICTFILTFWSELPGFEHDATWYIQNSWDGRLSIWSLRTICRCCTSLTCPVHSPPGWNVNVTREDVQGIVVVLGSQLQQHSLTPTFDGSLELKGQQGKSEHRRTHLMEH